MSTVRLHAWDAERPGATCELLSRVRPRHVLNAAALSSLAGCERDPERARLLNSDLPAELAELGLEFGFRLLHVSTDLVFGASPPSGVRYLETDPPSPMSVYGESKARGEQRVLARSPGALVVRLPLLVGDSHGSGRGGSDSLIAAIDAGEEVTLFEDEWRTPLDVGIAADACLEAIRLGVSGLLHIAGPERLSRFELGVRVLGARAGAVRRGRRADLGLERLRPRDVSLDTGLARSILTSPLSSGLGQDDAEL